MHHTGLVTDQTLVPAAQRPAGHHSTCLQALASISNSSGFVHESSSHLMHPTLHYQNKCGPARYPMQDRCVQQTLSSRSKPHARMLPLVPRPQQAICSTAYATHLATKCLTGNQVVLRCRARAGWGWCPVSLPERLVPGCLGTLGAAGRLAHPGTGLPCFWPPGWGSKLRVSIHG